MRYAKKTALTLVAAALLGGGCQDLVVENTQSPDRRRALAQPDAVELLAASTFPIFYNRVYRGTSGYVPLPMTADEVTNSSNTSGGRDLSTLPRRPYDNNPVNDDQYSLVELTWSQHYEAFSNATDALKVINDGLVIETGDPVQDNTHRVRVFAKLMQGLSLGYIGLLFDQAYVYDETTPDEVIQDPIAHELGVRPYTEIIAKAVELLEEAIQLAQAEAFTIPAGWMYTQNDVGPADVINIAHAYAARYLVLSPRTPAERESIDWQAVLAHAGAVTDNVSVELGSNSSGRRNNYVARAHSTSSNSRWYASNLLIGTADVSGNFQAWLNTPAEERTRFLITTPDRRVTGAGGPMTDGKYFRYLETNLVNALYGTYRESFYQWSRYRDNGAISNRGDEGIFHMVTLDEMHLYIAEAHLRNGQLELARDIINATRVANGELPPVTVDGVADAADCVPRTETGACGSLMDALIHERMLELAFMDPVRTWGDKRGFGRLTTGTVLHLPIPYEQQRILDMPYYTFGGNLPGSAQ